MGLVLLGCVVGGVLLGHAVYAAVARLAGW